MSAGVDTRPNAPVVVLCDPTPSATNAAWRAALVATQLGAPLRLLHVAPAALRAQASHQVLSGLASRIRGRFGIEVESAALCGDPLQEALRATSEARMLVVGPARANPMRDWIMGTQAERLIRMCHAPVLVVKLGTPSPYRKVLVPTDLRPDGSGAVSEAASVAQGAMLEVFHVVAERAGVTVRASGVPAAVLQDRSRANLDGARERLTQAMAAAGAPSNATASVAFGSAAEMIVARANAMGVDLVVMDKRPRGALAEFLLGSVTRRVLADARMDVLVLTGRGRPD